MAGRDSAKAVAVQIEVSFIPLHVDQPVFGDIDLALRGLGFVPHMFAAINKKMIAPMLGPTPAAAMNQMVEADAVYVRDFIKADRMDSEQLKHLAVIAHHCYGSFDLVVNCVHHPSAARRLPPAPWPVIWISFGTASRRRRTRSLAREGAAAASSFACCLLASASRRGFEPGREFRPAARERLHLAWRGSRPRCLLSPRTLRIGRQQRDGRLDRTFG